MTTLVSRIGPPTLKRFRLTIGPRLRAGSLATGAVLLWATWPALATASAPAPPFLVFGLAATIGFVLSLVLAQFRGVGLQCLSVPPRAVAIVVFGLLGHNILFLHAVPRIGASEANVVAYLWPILVVVLSAWAFGERLQRMQWAGMALAFAGVTIAIGPSFAQGLDLVGIGLALLSGLAFAIMSTIRSRAKEIRDVIGPSMGVIAVVAIVAHLFFEEPAQLSMFQLLVIAGIGIAPVTLANVLWDRATRYGQAPLIAGIAYATPIVALGLLAAFGLSSVTFQLLIGACLVVLGAVAGSGLAKQIRSSR